MDSLLYGLFVLVILFGFVCTVSLCFALVSNALLGRCSVKRIRVKEEVVSDEN